jgi:ankyrin repeat protein
VYGTALQAAASEGEMEIVRLLLDKGADINAQGGEYGTALHAAVLQGEMEIVRLLLDKGADVNAQRGPYGAALQAAAWRGITKIVRLLLDKGADVSAQGGEYRTALHAATLYRDTEVVRLLLDEGAQTNIPDFSEARPLQLAVQKRDLRTARLLLPRSTDSMRFVEASAWRSLLPGSEQHLEIANGQSTTITKRQENDIRGRGYPLLRDVTELAARANDFMGVDIRSRRLLYVFLVLLLMFQRSHPVGLVCLAMGFSFRLPQPVSIVVGGVRFNRKCRFDTLSGQPDTMLYGSSSPTQHRV